MPYAIIRTGGKQFRVEPGRTYKIPSLEGEEGGAIEFNDVLVGNDGKAVKTGVPTLKGASVTGEIVRHGRGDKIIVFKQKRRKHYARKRRHRQGLTDVRNNPIRPLGLAMATRRASAPPETARARTEIPRHQKYGGEE
jgi:large subunit ribosomal protein L21